MPQTAPIFSTAAKNAALDARLDVLNSGFIDIYNGTRPAGPGTAVTTQTKLVRLSFGATAFAAASGGSKVANAIATATILAGGTPTWARLLKSDGTAICDLEVACTLLNGVAQDTTTANVVLAAGPLVQGADCSLSSVTISET